MTDGLEKNLLRNTTLLERNQLAQEEYLELSRRAVERLSHWKTFSGAKSVLLYVSKDREVFTHALVRDCLNSGKIVVLPRANVASGCLELFKIKSFEDLSEGSYEILEPLPDFGKTADIYSIDAIVVPGICFDTSGFRIGYGKGYYDKLLAQMRDTGKLCSVAFDFQLINHVPAEAFDIPVDFIFTESQIIDCMKNRKKGAKPKA